MIVQSKTGVDYDYSSTQFNFPKDISEEILEFSKQNIRDEDLYDADDKGRENEIHVTVLYGLLEKNPEKIYEGLKDAIDKHILIPVKVKLGKVSRFENDDYDVIKIDIECEDLHILNKYIRNHFEYENDFPEYSPHITLAYVKKGKCDIDSDTFENRKVILNEFKISAPDSDKSKFIKVSGRKKYTLILKSSTDIKYARELLNSLLYHDIKYVIEGNMLMFRNEVDLYEAKRMLKGYGIFSLEKKGKKIPWGEHPLYNYLESGFEKKRVGESIETKYGNGIIIKKRYSYESKDMLIGFDIDFEDKRKGTQFVSLEDCMVDSYETDIKGKDISKTGREHYELLNEPEHQALQSSEPEKTDITNEDELTTFKKMYTKYKKYLRG